MPQIGLKSRPVNQAGTVHFAKLFLVIAHSGDVPEPGPPSPYVLLPMLNTPTPSDSRAATSAERCVPAKALMPPDHRLPFSGRTQEGLCYVHTLHRLLWLPGGEVLKHT